MSKPHKIPAHRLTRQQVAAGLESVPIEVVLLGAAGAKSTKLTAKQKAFAEGLAMGKTKAGAYRDAYNSKAKPHHQSLEGQRLAANPAIAQQVEALTLAAEAAKYATPAALRALVIQQLTTHALAEDVKPAQRIKALELLGKVTEVAAFTERREIIKTTDAGSARAALLETLRQALRSNAIDAKIIETTPAKGNCVTLQACELVQPGSQDAAQAAAQPDPGRVNEAPQPDPTTPPPPAQRAAHAPAMLSNPHTGSDQISDISVDTQICQSATRVTPVTVPGENPDVTDTRVTPVTLPSETTDDSQVEGGRGEKNPWVGVSGVVETPPDGNWK